MKTLITIAFFILNYVVTAAQTSDSIFWRKNYFLKTSDFAAKPDTSKIDLANSSIGIWYSYKIINNKVSYSTICYFLKSLSWTKYDWAPLLDHEQTHFDIAAYFSLKLLDTLQNSKIRISELETRIKPMYASIVQQRLNMDNYYDRLEKANPSTGIPQKKFHREIRNKIELLERRLKKTAHNIGFCVNLGRTNNLQQQFATNHRLWA